MPNSTLLGIYGEILFDTLADQHTFAEWDRDGRKGLAENVQDEVDRILAGHQVPPLDEVDRILAGHQVPPLDDVHERELEKIMQIAERELVRK